MNAATREQAIAIAAAIFAVRDLANCKDPLEPRATRAIEEAISKARYLVEVIERKLAAASAATGKQK
jgi:NADH dehydrogenase FAD-containing subunit